MEGLDGGLWYEYNQETKRLKEKHWWPQAEAHGRVLCAYGNNSINVRC